MCVCTNRLLSWCNGGCNPKEKEKKLGMSGGCQDSGTIFVATLKGEKYDTFYL